MTVVANFYRDCRGVVGEFVWEFVGGVVGGKGFVGRFGRATVGPRLTWFFVHGKNSVVSRKQCINEVGKKPKNPHKILMKCSKFLSAYLKCFWIQFKTRSECLQTLL